MRTITLSTAIGVIVSLFVISLLRPLNAGAVAVVVIVCCGLAAGIGRIFSRKKDSE